MTKKSENQFLFLGSTLAKKISDYINRSDPEEIAELSRKITEYAQKVDTEFQSNLAVDPRISQVGMTRKDFDTKQFVSFNRTDNPVLFDRFYRWKPENRYGIFCYGAYGTGKSHLLKSLLIKNHTKKIKCFYISANDLFEILRDPTAKEEEKKLLVPNLLGIDDIGNEYLTDFVAKRFLNFLDKRNASFGVKYSFVTTNFSLEEIQKIYDKRSLDRLKEQMIFCESTGRTYRDNIYLKNLSDWKNHEN